MIDFIIKVNGRIVCNVPLNKNMVRGVNITWIGESDERPDHMILFDFGGTEESHRVQLPPLAIGDEVCVKIAGSANNEISQLEKQ